MASFMERLKNDIRHIREHGVMQLILVFMFILSISAFVGLILQMIRTNESSTLSICIIVPSSVIMIGSACILCYPIGEKADHSSQVLPEEVRIDIPTMDNPILSGSPKKVKSQLEALSIRAPKEPSSYKVRRLEYADNTETNEENPIWKSVSEDEKSPKKKKGRSSSPK
jgi:hypothetical protein